MEFDWTTDPADLGGTTPREIEESFEDPFSLRLLPDFETSLHPEARYFLLGRSISGKSLFNLFWTDGKRYRLILSREMTPVERGFYERKNADALS